MSPEFISFIFFVIIYGIGFYSGRRYMIQKFTNMMHEQTDEMIIRLQMIKQLDDMDEEEIQTEVVVEQHNDSYFVYNKSTKMFLGQGPSVDEAMTAVIKRFPGQAFFYEEAN